MIWLESVESVYGLFYYYPFRLFLAISLILDSALSLKVYFTSTLNDLLLFIKFSNLYFLGWLLLIRNDLDIE